MRRILFFLLFLFFSVFCFAQQNSGFRIIGRLPGEGDDRIYQIQVGTFMLYQNAEIAFEKLNNASLNPAYENFFNFTRVVINGVAARDVPSYLQRIRNTGFTEVILKIDGGAAVQPPVSDQPVINSFTPEFFYLDRNTERVIQISGTNFLEESEIYLQGLTGTIYPDSKTIISNGSATLYFDDMKLIPGNYDIYVKNPGGVSTHSGRFFIGYRKYLDFFLKPALTPVIPIYGPMKELIGPNVYLAGLSLSFEAISSVRGSLNGGLELAASAIFIDPTLSIQTGNENYQMSYIEGGLLLTSIDLNIALQRRFNRNRMALTFRFGLGAVTMNHFNNSEENETIIELNLGLNFLMRLIDNFYLEAGMDFNNQMTSEPSGMIKPRLGVVWQF